MGAAMRCLLLSIFILPCGLLWNSPVLAAKPLADEFIAPLQAPPAASPPRSPQPSGRVRIIKNDPSGMLTLRASTAQDAITAAVSQRQTGCQMMRFGGDGFGWIATGAAHYAAATVNPATERRITRFKAFMDARMRLTDCLQTLPLETRQRISERLGQDDAIRLALINLAANDAQRQEQALRILARGFVAYAVEDDAANHAIRVHLVATSRTATRLTRPAAHALEAVSLAEGLKQSVAEISSGLIPTVGNRLIVVNATGEVALVGYAIYPVGALTGDPATQDALRAEAEQEAIRRATGALTGLATGDDAGWQSGLDPASRAEIGLAASGYADGEPSTRRFSHIRDLMLTQIKDDFGLQNLREGKLPMTANIKHFGDHETVTVMVIYMPSVRKREVTPPAQQPAIPATSTELTPTENR